MERLISLLKVPVMVLLIATVSYFLYSNVKLHDSVSKGWQEATQYTGSEKLQKSPQFLFRAENKLREKLTSQQDVVFELNRNRLMLEGKISQGQARMRSLEGSLEANVKEYLDLKEEVEEGEDDFNLSSQLDTLVSSINRQRLEKTNLDGLLTRSRDALLKNRSQLEVANSTILQLESDLENVIMTQSLAEVFKTNEGVLSFEAASEINSLMADVRLISESLENENYSYISDYIIENSLATQDSFNEFIENYDSIKQSQ